jgi:hypothetical protein
MPSGAKGLGWSGGIADRLDPEIHDELLERIQGLVIPRAIISAILQKPNHHLRYELLRKDHGFLVGSGLKKQPAPGPLREVRALIQINVVALLGCFVLLGEWALLGGALLGRRCVCFIHERRNGLF